jgi:hypothetical protein
LGDTLLQNIFNRGLRSIYRWSADRDFTADNTRNPVDRLRVLFSRLTELGRRDMACAALRILAEACGCEIQERGEAEPDKCDIRDECLDDYPAVAEFHESIRDEAEMGHIYYLKEEAKKELDETFVCHQLTKNHGHLEKKTPDKR